MLRVLRSAFGHIIFRDPKVGIERKWTQQQLPFNPYFGAPSEIDSLSPCIGLLIISADQPFTAAFHGILV